MKLRDYPKIQLNERVNSIYCTLTMCLYTYYALNKTKK